MMTGEAVLPKSVRQGASSSRVSIMLITICLLGLGLRLFGLTSESLGLDQLVSLKVARMPLTDLGVYLLKKGCASSFVLYALALLVNRR